ncbi:hypothetical protein ACLI1A_10325 [Flavobacterium sp. RHBU_3]|uniref:hypothetical protein n=1 Tax=Flavobacterium sp. RHBU_3 TaxID=3391184 RepID=UPI0039850707
MKRLSELMALAMEQSINPATDVEWTIRYSGPVNQLELRYYDKGLSNMKYEDAKVFEAYLNNKETITKACKFLEKYLTTLAS